MPRTTGWRSPAPRASSGSTSGHGRLGETAPVALYRDGALTSYTLMDTGWEASFIHSTRHYIKALREGLPPPAHRRGGPRDPALRAGGGGVGRGPARPVDL